MNTEKLLKNSYPKQQNKKRQNIVTKGIFSVDFKLKNAPILISKTTLLLNFFKIKNIHLLTVNLSNFIKH